MRRQRHDLEFARHSFEAEGREFPAAAGLRARHFYRKIQKLGALAEVSTLSGSRKTVESQTRRLVRTSPRFSSLSIRGSAEWCEKSESRVRTAKRLSVSAQKRTC